MTRRTRLIASFLLLTVLLGVPILLTWRAVRQERLNRALIAAVMQGNVDTVVSLLHQGADPNTREHSGPSVSFRQAFFNLFVQLRSGNTKAHETGEPALLLAVDPTAPEGDQGVHPIDANIINTLLIAGADPNSRDADGVTALMYAVESCPDQVKTLLDKGADVNAKGPEGETALMNTVTPATARLLLDRGADVNAQDDNGRSVLSVHVGRQYKHSSEVVRVLLEGGEDVNASDKQGVTPLIQAVQYGGDMASVRLLLRRRADVNARDNNDWTALMYAANRDEADIAEVLLKSHAAINIKDSRGQTAYRIARQQGNWKAAALLKQAGAKE